MAGKTPEQQSSATNVRVDVHVEASKPQWESAVEGAKKNVEHIKRELRETLVASGMSEEEITNRFKKSIDLPQNTDEDILRIAHNMLTEQKRLTQPERETVSTPVSPEAQSISPEHMKLEEFTKLLRDPSKREQLLSAIQEQESAINALVTALGKKRTEMGQLEKDNEIEGWNMYRKELPSFKKFFRDLGTAPATFSDEVVSARYALWLSFFERSGQTMQSIRNLLGEGGVATKESTDKEVAPVSKVDTAKPIEAEKTDGPKPEEKKEDKTLEDPYAWRKGIEKFEGDLEYRKHYEDWLDTIQESVLKTMPNDSSYAYKDEFGQIEKLSGEARALLAEQTMGDEKFGMYGHILESDYTNEQKKAIADKISQILALADHIKKDVGVVEKVAEAPEAPVVEEGVGPLPTELEASRTAWQEAQRVSNEAESTYQMALKDYYKSLEGQSLWTGGGWKHEFNKFFGVRPELTDELKALKEKTLEAHKAYAEQGILFAQNRYQGKVEDRLKEKYGANGEKVIERYKQKLGQKLVVHTIADRLELQKKAIEELHPYGTMLSRISEKMHKYRTARMALTVGAYSLVGLASGGVGLGVVMGGAKVAGLIGGMVVGGRAGTYASETLQEAWVDRKMRGYQGVRKEIGAQAFTKEGLSADDVAEMERRIEKGLLTVRRADTVRRVVSTTAAGLAGFAVGGGIGSATDVLDMGPASSAELPKAPSVSVLDKNTTPETTVPSSPKITSPIPESKPEIIKSPLPEPKPGMANFPPTPVVENEMVIRDIPESRVKDDQVFTESRVKDDVVPRTLPEIPKESMPKPFVNLFAEGPKMPEIPKVYEDSMVPKEVIPDSLPKSFDDVPVEVMPKMGTDMYEVQGGDNLWNILEGDVKGRPMSEVLESIPEKDRNAVLSKLFEKVDNDPALREAIGMKSDHADKIFVGEKLNIFALDKALGETYLEMQNGKPNSGEIRIPEPRPSIPVPESKPSIENVATPDGQAEIAKVYEKITTPLDTTTVLPTEPTSSESEIVESRTKDDVVSAPPAPTENVEALPKEVEARKQSIINEVERPVGGIFNIFGGPNLQGTYEAIQGMTFDDIVKLQQAPRVLGQELVKLGITEEGWNKWTDKVNELVESGVDTEYGETLGSFINRVAENQARNGVVT